MSNDNLPSFMRATSASLKKDEDRRETHEIAMLHIKSNNTLTPILQVKPLPQSASSNNDQLTSPLPAPRARKPTSPRFPVTKLVLESPKLPPATNTPGSKRSQDRTEAASKRTAPVKPATQPATKAPAKVPVFSQTRNSTITTTTPATSTNGHAGLKKPAPESVQRVAKEAVEDIMNTVLGQLSRR
jgi:hypothetical protein